MSRKKEFGDKCSFSPLRGERFRCNQTGKVMKKRAVPSYRRNIVSKELAERNRRSNGVQTRFSMPFQPANIPKFVPVERAQLFPDGRIMCPYCNRMNRDVTIGESTRTMEATNCQYSDCNRTFLALPSPVPDAPIQRNEHEKVATCPFCSHKNDILFGGIRACEKCRRLFNATY